MARWKPGAPSRLVQAALELFTEHGYAQTTAAEIAQRAGLTERTFFRQFADKREVLFIGQQVLNDQILGAIDKLPDTTRPVDAVAAGLTAAAPIFEESGPARARQRQTVISANAELRERELLKMASLSSGVAETLRGRGIPDPTAGLAGWTLVSVLGVGFERWLDESEKRELAEIFGDTLDHLRAMLTGD